MKLGLISDIHSDLRALKKALDLLHEQGVEKIVCLGDMVEKGTDGDAVVRLLQECQIPCVLGNHDEAASSNQRWLREHGDLEHPAMRVRLLAEDVLDYLQNLPFSLRYVWKNKDKRVSVLLVHGTPTSNVDYLFSNSQPEKYKHIARVADADVIIFGHTHTPTRAFFDETWFFNPGAVWGESSQKRVRLSQGDWLCPSRTCATLSLPGCEFSLFDVDTGNSIEIPLIQ
jgi:putative phosphoesterase